VSYRWEVVKFDGGAGGGMDRSTEKVYHLP